MANCLEDTTVYGTISFQAGSRLAISIIQPSSEPFNDDGTFRQSVFFQTTGTAYISTALKAAHDADSNTKLYVCNTWEMFSEF
ncbi:hypothetical protein Ac2012v2_002323 [Leucoagaricus gongylophorus]